MLEALREFTIVHAMSAARRQVAADLWTKPIGLNHNPKRREYCSIAEKRRQ